MGCSAYYVKEEAYMVNINKIVNNLTNYYFGKGYLNRSQCSIVYNSINHKVKSAQRKYNDYEIKIFICKCIMKILSKHTTTKMRKSENE